SIFDPKIGNFKYACEVYDDITNLEELVSYTVYWMAPKQIRKYINQLKNAKNLQHRKFENPIDNDIQEKFIKIIDKITYPIIPSDQMLLKDKVLIFDRMIEEDNPIFDFISLEKGIELYAKRNHKYKEQAKQFIKEAANNDCSDAQKFYMNRNLEVKKDKEFGLEYLKLAAKENHERQLSY
ncbi:28456_t:CDS:2, partial [Gigaspora margarita]